jgi:hypothetical protein
MQRRKCERVYGERRKKEVYYKSLPSLDILTLLLYPTRAILKVTTPFILRVVRQLGHSLHSATHLS